MKLFGISAEGGEAVRHEIAAPEVAPLLPLPRMVLLPGEVLPLHILAERYVRLVDEALAGDRVIVVSDILPEHLVKPPHDPDVHAVGCAGFIVQHNRSSDGDVTVWILGLERVAIGEPVALGDGYRRVRVTYIPPAAASFADSASLSALRAELRAYLPHLAAVGGEDADEVRELAELADDPRLLALAARVLDLEDVPRRRLLETDGLVDRYLQIYAQLQERVHSVPAAERLEGPPN